MNFTHLLVPLDGSVLAESALPIARLIASSQGAELTLMMVLLPDDQPGWTRGPATYLQQAARPIRAAGVVVNTTLRVGAPSEAILTLSRECSADLVVMATHGRSGVTRVIFGSVAGSVLRSSAVPILLVHPNQRQTERLRTILVAVDGTPGGTMALAAAVPLARARAAKLVLVRATVPLPVWLYEPTSDQISGPDPLWDEDARQAAETYANGLAGRLRDAGLAAEGRGISGQPGAALVAVAEAIDADLIVMSTHAREGPMRAILGSVADEVFRRSNRPVLLVRRAASAHAAPILEASSTSEDPGFYELLPDTFAESEAGLPPHRTRGSARKPN
jgi:nucleotide-binding universal stress UspA family protein